MQQSHQYQHHRCLQDEPALVQSDPATLALRLRRQAGAASSGGSSASDAAPPLGWVADPSREAQRLDAWVEQVEALHQVGVRTKDDALERGDLGARVAASLGSAPQRR